MLRREDEDKIVELLTKNYNVCHKMAKKGPKGFRVLVLVMIQTKGKEPNAVNTSESEKMLYHCLYYTSDWFKHQILRNLCKTPCILIPCFLTNFLITNSRPSLGNTEILREEHVKL